jgi:hypothetical protein
MPWAMWLLTTRVLTPITEAIWFSGDVRVVPQDQRL